MNTPLMGHLGSRISALLDGQLPAAEAERAWAHVHACHACRDRVERDGWVKTRLAGLSGAAPAPAHLKGSLLGSPALPDAASLAVFGHRPRRNAGLVAIGGGAVGAAVVGVLALGAAPADSPVIDRRSPVTNLVRQTETPRPTTTTPRPVFLPGQQLHRAPTR